MIIILIFCLLLLSAYWQFYVFMITPVVDRYIKSRAAAYVLFILYSYTANIDHTTAWLHCHLIRNVEGKLLDGAMGQTNLKVECISAFGAAAGGAALLFVRESGYTEGPHLRYGASTGKFAVIEDGGTFLGSYTVAEVNSLGHTPECPANQCHMLESVLEFIVYHIGIDQGLHAHR